VTTQFLVLAALAAVQLTDATAQAEGFVQPALPDGAAALAEAEEEVEIIVQATRSRRRVQDEPIRVEVITREEIEEKALMRPGNVAMLVSETGGVRVQVTSPALGAANIRVQGMDGRYTRLLADGLPLYGGQSSSLGLLQIPPTDLARVEVIKGAASALYGPSALGGVINLVSRKPGDDPDAELLLNATTRNGQDATAYLATPLGRGLGGSVSGGLHRQSRADLDSDGWIDIPGYERWSIRPRLFFDGANGAKLFATVGAMDENRLGGTLPGRTVPDGTEYRQAQRTDRLDAGLTGELPVDGVGTVSVRASAMAQKHRHRFGDVIENDRHRTFFAETSLSGGSKRTPWIAGLAYQRDTYRNRAFPTFDYALDVPAIFGQIEHEVSDALTLASSARVDIHSDYGTQFSPRLSMLYRQGPWKVRASLGRGFYAPTPFVEETEAAGLSRLEPLENLEAETARTASIDVGYTGGRIESSFTLFAANIRNSTRLVPGLSADRVRLVNIASPTRIRGSEVLLRYRVRQFTLTGSYVYVDATEVDEAVTNRVRVPLTPKHTAGLVGMWEDHDKGRIGIEVYYTGRQRLEDNPYRVKSRPFFQLGLLGEVVVNRHLKAFVNAENLLGIRQTRYDPLVLPARLPDGRWNVDVWAPTDGFILNGGIRIGLSGAH
jgi:iron complex outermembrane receptor protein